MKKTFLYMFSLCSLALTLSSCSMDDHDVPVQDPNTGLTFATVGDQVGRPGVSTVFISNEDRDKFDATLPSVMGIEYQPKIQAQLMALNPNFTTNFLGLTAAQFTGVLATDVLSVTTSGKTTYYDANNVLTGRALDDDVIDDSFFLIWGGPKGTDNPGKVSDHVDHNDKPFLTTFPYEAAPW